MDEMIEQNTSTGLRRFAILKTNRTKVKLPISAARYAHVDQCTDTSGDRQALQASDTHEKPSPPSDKGIMIINTQHQSRCTKACNSGCIASHFVEHVHKLIMKSNGYCPGLWWP